MVGKSNFKENPKSDLDLDLGFVKIKPAGTAKKPNSASVVVGVAMISILALTASFF